MIIRPEELLKQQVKRLVSEVERTLFYSGEARSFSKKLISLSLIGRTLEMQRDGCEPGYAKGLQAFPSFLEEMLNRTDSNSEEDEP